MAYADSRCRPPPAVPAQEKLPWAGSVLPNQVYVGSPWPCPRWSLLPDTAVAVDEYEGFGAFVGNAVMGMVFALFFLRGGRVMPLIVAHSLLDIAALVGYTLLRRLTEVALLKGQ